MFSYIEKLSTIDDFKTFKENNEKVVFIFLLRGAQIV